MPKSRGSVSKARPQSGVSGTVALHPQVCWQERRSRWRQSGCKLPAEGRDGDTGATLSLLREETRRSQVCSTSAILPHKQAGVYADKHLQEQALPQCTCTITHTHRLRKVICVTALTSILFPLLSASWSHFLTLT